MNTRMLISLLVFVTAWILAEACAAHRSKAPDEPTSTEALSWREMSWVFVPFCAVYFALLLPRTLYEFLYDRYFLGLMPFAIIALLRLHRRWFGKHVPWIAFAALALFALESVAGTHDWFATNRARLRAVNEVHAAGVPKNYIQGGFEYDGWTQVDVVGHVNERRIRVPKGTYIFVRRTKLPRNCEHFFSVFESGIDPDYVITGSEMPCFERTEFPPVRYRAWLPPFDRNIYVQQMRSTP